MGHIGVSLFFILSGASLMYSTRRGLEIRSYLKKRFLSIYPLYWITYAAFFTHFYIINRLPMTVPKSSLLLSFLGMDGYLYYKIPCYYLVGEWFVGCILILYLLFPLLRRLVLEHPRATALVTAVLYVPYLYVYPFQMENERLFFSRIPEFLFGMYFAVYFYGAGKGETKKDVPPKDPISWKAGLFSLAAFLFIFFIPVELPQLYRIMWVGASAFTALAWISQFTTGTGWPGPLSHGRLFFCGVPGPPCAGSTLHHAGERRRSHACPELGPVCPVLHLHLRRGRCVLFSVKGGHKAHKPPF